MVTATTAEVTAYGVNIKGPGGQTIRARSANLRDPDWDHGINLDEGDELVTELGYLAATYRWQDGGYYKAVVLPEAEMRARWPKPPPELAPDVLRLQNIHATG